MSGASTMRNAINRVTHKERSGDSQHKKKVIYYNDNKTIVLMYTIIMITTIIIIIHDLYVSSVIIIIIIKYNSSLNCMQHFYVNTYMIDSITTSRIYTLV